MNCRRVQYLSLSNNLNCSLSCCYFCSRADLLLLKQSKIEGKPIAVLQFERAQKLKKEGLQIERDMLRAAVLTIVKDSESITLGIMAETGERAIQTLRSWVTALELPRGVLRAVEETSAKELEIDALKNLPVYLKYGPALSGDAYMKQYAGGNVGVIFQPKLRNQKDDDFFQFGDLPLSIFT